MSVKHMITGIIDPYKKGEVVDDTLNVPHGSGYVVPFEAMPVNGNWSTFEEFQQKLVSKFVDAPWVPSSAVIFGAPGKGCSIVGLDALYVSETNRESLLSAITSAVGFTPRWVLQYYCMEGGAAPPEQIAKETDFRCLIFMERGNWELYQQCNWKTEERSGVTELVHMTELEKAYYAAILSSQGRNGGLTWFLRRLETDSVS